MTCASDRPCLIAAAIAESMMGRHDSRSLLVDPDEPVPVPERWQA
ncbi:MAG: hypothetical protein ACK51F_11320 [Rhodospirillales bacterium]|jgi:hypothetical protein